METKTLIDRELNCVFIIRRGEAEPGSLVVVVREAIQRDDFVRGMNFLVDHRRVEISDATYSRLAGRQNEWGDIADLAGPCKIAVVHSSDHNFGIGRQVSSVLVAEKVNRRPFRNFPDALEFLGLPPETPVPDFD